MILPLTFTHTGQTPSQHLQEREESRLLHTVLEESVSRVTSGAGASQG